MNLDDLISSRQQNIENPQKSAVLVDHRLKLKESKERYKYLQLARKLKKYGTGK